MIPCGENKGFIMVLGGNSIMNINIVLEMQYLIVEYYCILAVQLCWWEVGTSILA